MPSGLIFQNSGSMKCSVAPELRPSFPVFHKINAVVIFVKAKWPQGPLIYFLDLYFAVATISSSTLLFTSP